MLTDTHAHLYTEEFDADRAEVVRRAVDSGVKKIYLPNIDSSSIATMLKLEEAFPENCFAMMGLHPGSVNEKYGDELQVVEHWLGKRKFCAIGEIGMDHYWDKTFIAQQKDAFARQIDLAKKYSLPVIIHQRECFDDVFQIVQSKMDKSLRGIFHCFTGTSEQAERIISLGGFKLGIGGVLTYKKSGLPETVKRIDLRHIVLETDSPYLPPAPHRGKRNESSYIALVAQKIAEIKGIPAEEVAAITTKNAEEIFGR